MSNIKLYIWPEADGLPSSSPYCLKVMYALKYKKVPFEIEYVKGAIPDWVRRGKLPIAVIGKNQIEDSTNILTEVDKITEDSDLSLYPSEPKLRAETTVLEDWADEAFTINLVFHRWAIDRNFEKFAPQAFRDVPIENQEKAIQSSRDYHLRMLEERGIAYSTGEERKKQYEQCLKILDQRLSDRLFLVHERPTAADFATFPSIQIALRAPIPELAPLIKSNHKIMDWVMRMEELCQ